MALAPGTRLGNYEILEPLGKGGMGEVYRARDTKLGRDVAIKVLPAALANDPERLGRFEREAKVLASLNHPNIATIFGLEESAEGKAIAMELVEGGTLKSPRPPADALKIAMQIAEALEAAHEKGVTHRDLKPANIMVTPGGLVKVLDFGLAAVARHSSGGAGADAPTLTMGATEAGIIMGTPAYMSPEQAVGHPVDKRADIWSFGVVLWEMLTGKSTFAGDTVPHILENVIRTEIDFKELPQTTPAAIRDLIKRCLDRDVRTRLRDIGEARVTIQKYLAHPAEPTPAHNPEPVIADRRGLKLALASGVLAILVALALGFLLFRGAKPVAQTTRFQIPLQENMAFGGLGVFALSPDGRKLVFDATTPGGMPQLWIRSLDSLTMRPLPETANPGVPFWSRDGRFVVYSSGGKLKKIDVSSGPPQTICDAPSYGGGAWNRDNIIVFGTNQGVMRVSASGGTPSLVTNTVGKNNSHVLPVFLPDGNHFVHLSATGPPASWGLFLGSLDKKPQEQSTQMLVSTPFGPQYRPSGEAASGQLLFLREGTVLAQTFDEKGLRLQGEPVPVVEQVGGGSGFGFFAASENGSLVYRHGTDGNRQLTWYDRKGQVAGTPGEPGRYTNVKVSPDGTKAMVVRVDPQSGNPDLWMVDLIRGSNIRFTFDPAVDLGPVWSPDGSRVAWNSNRGGFVGIYSKASNGSGVDELLYNAGPRALQTTDWTRDGKFILYQQRSETGGRDILALPVGGTAADRKPIPIVQTPADEAGGYVSPDNRWIAYISDETGRQEIYVQPFAPSQKAPVSAGKWAISKGTQGAVRWRDDGKELVFAGLAGEMMATDTTPGPTFQYGTPHLLFQLPTAIATYGGAVGAVLDTARDNQRFLLIMPVVEKERPEFIVEMNGLADVKR